MKVPSVSTAAALLVYALSAHSALAQSAPTLSGVGTATMKKDPQVMRLKIDLLAKGKDLKESLGKLKARREAVGKKLTELGVNADSVKFGSPKVLQTQSDQRRQMEMMVRARMKKAKPAADEPARKDPIKVTVSLQAEWPIKGDTPEDRLLALYEVQEKIRAADLAGKKEAEELTPEEKEAAEEEEADENANMYNYGDDSMPVGEPAFLFVANVTDEERAKLLAEAFTKAKAQAARLALAAGVKQGPLYTVQSGENPYGYGEDFQGYGGVYRNYMYQMLQSARGAQGHNEHEAIGIEPEQVSIQVTVTAAFAIQ